MNSSKRNGVRKYLTVRGVDPELARALTRERKRRGATLNQTVLDLLSGALGTAKPFDNGLGKYAGGWTEEEYQDFKRRTSVFDRVDKENWR